MLRSKPPPGTELSNGVFIRTTGGIRQSLGINSDMIWGKGHESWPEDLDYRDSSIQNNPRVSVQSRQKSQRHPCIAVVGPEDHIASYPHTLLQPKQKLVKPGICPQ